MTITERLLSGVFLLAGLTLFAAPAEKPGYRIDFSNARNEGKTVSSWVFKGKPGTAESRFTIERINGRKVLCMRSRKASGTLIFDLSKVDLNKYPYMRWKWRVDVFPAGADGRYKSKDDQAITLYLGCGTAFSQTSTAYRWETLTPKNATGFVTYGFGMVKVNWRCVRNSRDGKGKWFIDECNAKRAYENMCKGKVPAKRALSISANSQYTASSSVAYLEYIEFYAQSMNKTNQKGNRK